MKSIKQIIPSLLLIINISLIYGQETKNKVLHYTPERGFELDIPVIWKFTNCMGEIYVDMIHDEKGVTSGSYVYEGSRYTTADLGSAAFSKPECMGVAVGADVYHGNVHLGYVEMDYILSISMGCLGTSVYKLNNQLSLNDTKFKDQLASFSLQNMEVIGATTYNAKIENQIAELKEQAEKKEQYLSFVQQGEEAYARGNYEKAASYYKKALNTGYEHSDPNLPDPQALVQKKEDCEKKLDQERKSLAQEESYSSEKEPEENSKYNQEKNDEIDFSDYEETGNSSTNNGNPGYEFYQQYQQNAREIEESKAEVATEVANMVTNIYNDIEANRAQQLNRMNERRQEKQNNIYRAYQNRDQNREERERNISFDEKKILVRMLNHVKDIEFMNGTMIVYSYHAIKDNTSSSFIYEKDLTNKIQIGNNKQIDVVGSTFFLGGTDSKAYYGKIKEDQQELLFYNYNMNNGNIEKEEYFYKYHSTTLPTGNPLVFAKYYENQICLFNFIKDKSYCVYPKKGGNGNVLRLSSSESGRYLAVTIRNWGKNKVRVFDLDKSTENTVFETDVKLYTSCKFSKDDKIMYYISPMGEISGVDLTEMITECSHPVEAAYFDVSPDKKKIVSFKDDILHVYDAGTGSKLWNRNYRLHNPDKQISISPGSDKIVLFENKRISLIDIKTGMEIHGFPVRFSALKEIRFLGEGIFACFNDNGFEDTYVKVYNINKL